MLVLSPPIYKIDYTLIIVHNASIRSTNSFYCTMCNFLSLYYININLIFEIFVLYKIWTSIYFIRIRYFYAYIWNYMEISIFLKV